jgi:lactoylglutathione lyase
LESRQRRQIGASMRLNFCWTTLRISDMEASLRFYSEILGLPISSRHSGYGKDIVMLGLENQTKVELLHEDNGMTLKPEAGISIGFFVESLEDAMESLTGHGIRVSEIVAPSPNTRFFFVQDPDGFTIQLVESK